MSDYVEQDLAVTKDGVLICLHDESLERTTDVAERFPGRATMDQGTGRRQWLAADFTLAEIKQLDAGRGFGERFAGERVLTWEEAVEIVGLSAGLYPELKTPALYRARGIDQTGLFVESVRRLGLHRRPSGSLVVQSFEEQPLQDVSRLLPGVPRTFLIEVMDGPRWLHSQGLSDVAAFATGIGPAKSLLDGRPEIVRMAHSAGLTVTPYTFTSIRGGNTRVPDLTSEMSYFLYELGVDAVFTDNPDRFPRAPARP